MFPAPLTPITTLLILTPDQEEHRETGIQIIWPH